MCDRSMRKVILLFLTLCPGAFAQSNQPTTAPDPGALQWLDAMPKDKLGFAAPEKSDDFRVVYVSASVGDDRANSGLRPQIPVRTIARACQIARNHSDDEIRLLRGDTFDPWNVHGGGMNRNGRDPWHPFIVGAYGDPHRPRPKMTTQFGISGTNVLLRDLDFTCIRRDYTKAGLQRQYQLRRLLWSVGDERLSLGGRVPGFNTLFSTCRCR